MGLIVQKFGGSSVRDRERLLRAMRIVRRTWEQGDDLVVVLSAQGDTTDALLSRACELSDAPPPTPAEKPSGRLQMRRIDQSRCPLRFQMSAFLAGFCVSASDTRAERRIFHRRGSKRMACCRS